jgi:hypothetical protein
MISSSNMVPGTTAAKIHKKSLAGGNGPDVEGGSKWVATHFEWNTPAGVNHD